MRSSAFYSALAAVFCLSVVGCATSESAVSSEKSVPAAGSSVRALSPAQDAVGWREKWVPERHAAKLAEIAVWTNDSSSASSTKYVPVVFVGDSITHFWETNGKKYWDKYFAAGEFRALNLGVSADRTENVLWRIDNGELDGYEAGTVVVMIGTNNTGHFPREKETPAETVAGIRAVLDRIRAKQPNAPIVLCSVFPCDVEPDGQRRVRNAAVNASIRAFCDERHVFWCPMWDVWLDADGKLPASAMPDALHPATEGYDTWAKAVMPVIRRARACAGRSLCEIPADRLGERWWSDRLAVKLAEARATPDVDVVFMGDSITHGWEDKPSYAEFRKAYKILNIGYGGDRIEHALWHAENGELEIVRAKAVMLMIGTNNCGADPEKMEAGMKKLLGVIRVKQPQAKIFLLPVFPRGATKDDALRVKNARANRLLEKLADGKNIVWCDFTEKLLNADGTPKREAYCADNLHLLEPGYAIWRAEMEPRIRAVCDK